MKMPSLFPVASHTDNVGPGSTFVAIKGLNFDGADYIDVAIQKGATTLVVQEGFDPSIQFLITSKTTQDDSVVKINQSLPHSDMTNSQRVILSDSSRARIVSKDVSVIQVPDTRKALAELSAQAAGHPAKKLKLLGITGTKGKTTSVYVLNYLLQKAGHKTALLSTIKNSINGQDIPANMTTAQPDYLHQFFKLCVQEGVEYVVMEVAAQATTFSRLETLKFDGLIFTNLDREHAELYPTMQSYFSAKEKIFEYAKQDCSMVMNVDDDYGKELAQKYNNAQRLSLKKSFEWSDGEIVVGGNVFTYSNLPGLFNAYNLAGVLLLLKKLGVKVNNTIGAIPAIPGRLQKVALPNGAQAFIDYAHTPGSFKSVLSTVRQWTHHLIVIFGAGGGKDEVKRSLMGSVVDEYADIIILADDNPRTEDPKKIMQDILSGITHKSKVTLEHDRKKAIERAYGLSQEGSIIMILGKGPDEYQIIGTKKMPFSERIILENL